MDPAVQKMIDNLQAKFGKPLEEWISLVQNAKLTKHGEMIKFLKSEHGLTHGYANLIALKTREQMAGGPAKEEDLIDGQYRGKEHFRPIHDAVIDWIQNTFDNEVEIAPKKSSVSLRRKKQFALLKPATKTRFEIGLNLKDTEPDARVQEVTKANAMCSHQINLSGPEDLDEDVFTWLRAAYEQAG